MLSAVGDRFGVFGGPGAINVAWGNWENFVAYSNQLNAYASPSFGQVLAVAATICEVLFSILLIIGYKTRLAAWGTCLLVLAFALTMTFSAGWRAPLSYSVWTTAAAAGLLAGCSRFAWSVDDGGR